MQYSILEHPVFLVLSLFLLFVGCSSDLSPNKVVEEGNISYSHNSDTTHYEVVRIRGTRVNDNIKKACKYKEAKYTHDFAWGDEVYTVHWYVNAEKPIEYNDDTFENGGEHTRIAPPPTSDYFWLSAVAYNESGDILSEYTQKIGIKYCDQTYTGECSLNEIFHNVNDDLSGQEDHCDPRSCPTGKVFDWAEDSCVKWCEWDPNESCD